MAFKSAVVAVHHDTNNQVGVGTKAIHIGTAGTGTLKVTMADGTDVAFAGITAGTYLPISIKRVWSTGTGVSNVVLMY